MFLHRKANPFTARNSDFRHGNAYCVARTPSIAGAAMHTPFKNFVTKWLPSSKIGFNAGYWLKEECLFSKRTAPSSNKSTYAGERTGYPCILKYSHR